MSTINQCTKCVTGETRLIQFYRLCITCSAVGVCLNCAGICHENHTLGPVLREKFFCQCHQITNCCRAMNLLGEPGSPSHNLHEGAGALNGNSSKLHKKRKFLSTKTEKFYIWTRHNRGGKVFLSPFFQTKEEANQVIRRIFTQQNPWQLDEKDFYFKDTFTMQYDENGILFMKVTEENGECWEASADILEGGPPAVEANVGGQSHDESPAGAIVKRAKGAGQLLPPSVSHQTSLTGIQEISVKSSPNTLDDDDDMVIFTDLKPRYEDFADPDKDKLKKKGSRPKKEAGAPKDNPGMSMIDISRAIGQQWKALSAEEKLPYEELARRDKERYVREMEDYKRRKSNGELPVLPQVTPKPKGKPGPKPKPKITAIQEIENNDNEIENTSHSSPKIENDDEDSGSMVLESSDEKKYVVHSCLEESEGSTTSDHSFQSFTDLHLANKRARELFYKENKIHQNEASMSKEFVEELRSEDGLLTLLYHLPEGGLWKVSVEEVEES